MNLNKHFIKYSTFVKDVSLHTLQCFALRGHCTLQTSTSNLIEYNKVRLTVIASITESSVRKHLGSIHINMYYLTERTPMLLSKNKDLNRIDDHTLINSV